MIPAPQQYAPPPPPSAYPPPPPPPANAYPPGNYYPPQPSGAEPPPQAGYPPPQGGAYPPPQGGAYPPPQGGAYPPPPPNAAPARHGLLLLPFLGLNSYQGQTGRNTGIGLRLGTLLGGRLGDMFSANGEFTIDIINQDTPAGVDSVSRVQVVLAFSPLVHIPTGNMEIVVGPKLGFWGEGDSFDSMGFTDTGSASGFTLGVNAGIFGAISPSLSVGGLISFDVRAVREVCQTLSGESEVCSSDRALTGPADKVIGFNGALLF